MQDLFENIRWLIGSAGSSMMKEINIGRKNIVIANLIICVFCIAKLTTIFYERTVVTVSFTYNFDSKSQLSRISMVGSGSRKETMIWSARGTRR